MIDKEFRKALDTYCEQRDWHPVILDNESYDRAIVGITEDGRLVYDYWKMVEELMIDDPDCEYHDAIEWVDYNTIRAIPYMGEHAPIIIYSKKDIIDIYGERMPDERR